MPNTDIYLFPLLVGSAKNDWPLVYLNTLIKHILNFVMTYYLILIRIYFIQMIAWFISSQFLNVSEWFNATKFCDYGDQPYELGVSVVLGAGVQGSVRQEEVHTPRQPQACQSREAWLRWGYSQRGGADVLCPLSSNYGLGPAPAVPRPRTWFLWQPSCALP